MGENEQKTGEQQGSQDRVIRPSESQTSTDQKVALGGQYLDLGEKRR